MLPRSLYIRLALAGALLLLYTAQFRLYSGWAIDDPWISFQYARHLVEGKGLVFNPGERVEGYSNFLWVMQMAAAHALGFDMLTAAKTLGFIFGLLPILVMGLTPVWSGFSGVRGTKAEETLSTTYFLAALMLAASGLWAFWAAGGLETVQFASLSALGLAALGVALQLTWEMPASPALKLLWSERARVLFTRASALAAILMLLVALSRPEGAMFGVISMGVVAVLAVRYRREPHAGPLSLRLLMAFVLFFLLPFIAYMLWRQWYFGQWLPNTFYAKAYAPLEQQIRAGVEYLIKYFVLFSLPLLLGFGVWLFRLQAGRANINRLFMTGMIAVYGLFIVYAGGDWMPMGRFLVHILPPVAFVAASGFYYLWNGAEGQGRMVRGVIVGVFVITFAISGLYQNAETAPILQRVRYGAFWRPLVTAGEWLRENSPGDAVLAGEEAGIIPFTSRRRFVDMLGIVDPHIAQIKGALHQKYDAAYVLGREPDYILLHVTKDTGEGVYDSSREMLAQAAFRERYAEVHRITIGLAEFAEKPEHYNDLVIYKRNTGD